MKTIKYDKLVRDNIIDIIQNSGKDAKFKVVSKEEKIKYLLKKLDEEFNEFKESLNEEEMADILEVIDSIIVDLDLDQKKIIKIKEEKAIKNGAFKKNIVLEEVVDKT